MSKEKTDLSRYQLFFCLLDCCNGIGGDHDE